MNTPGRVPAATEGTILKGREHDRSDFIGGGPCPPVWTGATAGRGGGRALYRRAFEATRQAADAMMGLRVLVVTAKGCWTPPSGEFGFNKVVVPENRPSAPRWRREPRRPGPGASRCFLPCDHAGFNGELLTGFCRVHPQRPHPEGGPAAANRRGAHRVRPLPAARTCWPWRGGGRLRPCSGAGEPDLLL